MDGRISCLALALLLAGATLPAIAPRTAGAEPTLDALMSQLLHPDTVTREAALRDILRRGDRAAAPGLIDILYFDLFPDSTVSQALGRLTGQAFGHDWLRWVEWLAEREDVRPHREYAAWKADLLTRIDPAFGEFLYPGVKYRARPEEIQWGGVRKDGIPALTNPRHVPARAATYLTRQVSMPTASAGAA